MKSLRLALSATFTLATLCGAQVAPFSQQGGTGSAAAAGHAEKTQRRQVRVQAKPKTILPPAKDLVSTAESGASRSHLLPTVLSATSVVVTDSKAAAGSAAVGATSSPQKGHWVLMYRNAQCVACDRLMNAISQNGSPALSMADKLTVVVGEPQAAPAAALPAAQAAAHPAGRAVTRASTHTMSLPEQQNALDGVRSNFAALDRAAWQYDGQGAMFSALKPGGFPMMYGMDGEHIIWRSAGIPGGVDNTQQRVASWLATSPTVSQHIAASGTAQP